MAEKEEESRKERAAKLRLELDSLHVEAAASMLLMAYERCRRILNRCKDMEDQVKDLERFKTDEDFRLFLVRQMENGYH